jgi:hypothetical protein
MRRRRKGRKEEVFIPPDLTIGFSAMCIDVFVFGKCTNL